MTGKYVFIFILSQICSNGWWIAFKYQSIVSSNGKVFCLFLIPIIASIWIVYFLFEWIMTNWDENEITNKKSN